MLVECDRTVDRVEVVHRVGRPEARLRLAVDGATVYVRKPDGTEQPIYRKANSEPDTAAVLLTQPIKSQNGRIECWYEQDLALDLHVSKAGEIQSYVQRIVTGSKGVQGPQGENAIVWRGVWSSTTAYLIQDAVHHGGKAWIATAQSTGSEPGVGAGWSLMADRGPDTALALDQHDADALAHPALRTNIDARARKERLAVDVRDYSGIDLTGASDSSTDMALAVSQSAADGRRLYSPKAVIVCAAVLLKSGSHIVGDGMGNTIFKLLPSSTSGIFTTHDGSGASVDDVTLEGFTLDGDRVNSTVTGTAAGALLHSYEAARWHLSRLRLKNSRGYGFGWQGFPTAVDVAKQGPQTDLYMEFCELLDNGFLPDGTPNSSDNIDIKSSERIAMHAVYSRGSSDKGFNIRGRYVDLVACRAYQNVTGFDMNSNNDPANTDALDSYHTLTGCAAEANTGSGIAVTSTEDSACHADLIGCRARKNGSNGVTVNQPPAPAVVRLTVQGGKYVDNALRGLSVTGTQQLSVTGAIIRDNTGDGIRATDCDGGVITGNDIRNNDAVGVRSVGTSDKLIVTSNQVRGNVAGQIGLVGVANVNANNVTA